MCAVALLSVLQEYKSNLVPVGCCFKRECSCQSAKVPKACMSLRVQAELGNAADKEQERRRTYLLRRLLQALAAYCIDGLTADNIPMAGEMLALAPRSAKQRLDACTTAQLERHLAHFYDLLLMVRVAVPWGPAPTQWFRMYINRACGECF